MVLISFLKINQVLREYQKLNYEVLGKLELKFKYEKLLFKVKVSDVDKKVDFLYLKVKKLSGYYYFIN